MNYLCRICGEPALKFHTFNYFQEASCENCQEWLEEMIEYTRIKILNACGSYEVVNLLAQVDYSDREMFN